MQSDTVDEAMTALGQAAVWRLLGRKGVPTFEWFWKEANANRDGRKATVEMRPKTSFLLGQQPYVNISLPAAVKMCADDLLAIGWTASGRHFGFENLANVEIYGVKVIIDPNREPGDWEWII